MTRGSQIQFNVSKKVYKFDEISHGHPVWAFFQKFKTLGLDRQIGLKFFETFWVFSAKLLALFLAMWVPCPLENVVGSFSYKNFWFLSLKHITPKCSTKKNTARPRDTRILVPEKNRAAQNRPSWGLYLCTKGIFFFQKTVYLQGFCSKSAYLKCF